MDNGEDRKRTKVEIDPNVRLPGGNTYSGIEDADGPLFVGDYVDVVIPETTARGEARITHIDHGKHLVYLDVNWSTLTDIGGGEAQ